MKVQRSAGACVRSVSAPMTPCWLRPEDGTAELIDGARAATWPRWPMKPSRAPVVEKAGGGELEGSGRGCRSGRPGLQADSRLLATGSTDHTARLWDTTTRRETARLEHDDSVVSVAFHPQRPWLATGSKDGSARLWNLADGTLLRRIEGHDEMRAVLFSPNGRYLAASTPVPACNLLICRRPLRSRAAGAGAVPVLAWPSAPTAPGWPPPVATAPAFRRGKWAPIIRGDSPQPAQDGQPEHFKWIDQVAFSADGESLATAGRDGTARVWDLVNRQEVVRLPHQAPVQSLAFSPDGAQLLTASSDGTARLWDLPLGRERLRAVHPGGSENVAFSPRDRLVASGGSDGSIGLWRLTSGDEAPRMIQAEVVRSTRSRKCGGRHRAGRPCLASVDGKGEFVSGRVPANCWEGTAACLVPTVSCSATRAAT